jgi:hypothetical protein
MIIRNDARDLLALRRACTRVALSDIRLLESVGGINRISAHFQIHSEKYLAQ